MASGESKLLALHRLDFYKRKKNWKLPEDVRKVPPSSLNITNKLNKTYNIVEEFPEPEFDVEQVSSHNKAFLERTDDDLEPQLTDDDALVPQLPNDEALEPQVPDDEALESQLPDDEALEPQIPNDEAPSLPPLENMYRPATWANQVWSGDKTGSLWEKYRQYWCGTEDKGVREEVGYDQYDGACNQHNLWRPDPASQLELHPAVDPLGRHLEYLTPEQMRQIAGEWLTLHNYSVKQEEYADSYEEYRVEGGTADFMRGSHYAPHSTEIDLSITQECGCTCNNLYELPVRKLAQAIRRHHSALTVLLREQALRERLYPQSLLHHPLPFENYPMRDTDPLRPDVVLSGSHHVPSVTGYDADTGRGRGRLQQQRLVGIGMGRPYWKVNEIVE